MSTGDDAEAGGGPLSGRRGGRYADEPALVVAVQEGDRAAFSVLVHRYMEPAYAVSISLLHREQDAEDAVQAAFLRALEKIDQLRPGSPFGPWFYRVLRSTCLNLRRREALRTHEAMAVEPAGRSDPASDLERKEMRQRLLEALEQVPEAQRLAVLLYDLEGYDHTEIAEILEIASGTSRANLHHGRRALREILGAESGEADEPKGD
ncbi:MAG: RNA polymerase sigma factor [Gemmatimonadota bacterium]